MAQDMLAPQGAKDPIIEKMEVESDKRLGKFLGVFAIIGGAFVGYALTVEVMIPVALYATTKDDTSQVVMKLADVEKKKDEEKKKNKNAPPKPRKKAGGGGKPRGRGVPNAPVTQAALKLITSRTTSSSLSSYDLMNQKFAKDLDKVINNVSGLTKTGQTRLGARRGKADGGWNEGYAVGGSGGVDDLLGGLWGGDAGPLGVKAKGGLGLKAPSASDIDMGQESGQRSTESILRVIRQHTPGLRHTYNKYLKTNPGFKGKITLKFSIAPSGAIVELTVVGTTTGVSEFDQEIREKVRTWRFEPVKGKSNDVVTVPFTFSE
ncbi:MAG TPA: AgmX/PglI C-terminal domain-containing protein [Fibrobacteria bacterium]|nr:AgmX/PglI C-terminal domain-containing protein [Fibrobacteria bacterium]